MGVPEPPLLAVPLLEAPDVTVDVDAAAVWVTVLFPLADRAALEKVVFRLIGMPVPAEEPPAKAALLVMVLFDEDMVAAAVAFDEMVVRATVVDGPMPKTVVPAEDVGAGLMENRPE